MTGRDQRAATAADDDGVDGWLGEETVNEDALVLIPRTNRMTGYNAHTIGCIDGQQTEEGSD